MFGSPFRTEVLGLDRSGSSVKGGLREKGDISFGRRAVRRGQEA